MYDIVFISYKEPNAAENYAALKDRFPMTKPVDGVKGIHQAHIAAAKKCFTKMFWIVDGDAQILDSFNFDYEVPDHQLDHVHVWRSKNPINGLEYGYGGVKLFPRRMTIKMDTSKADMTTSISDNFRVMNEISNITAFNTDPFNTWKSAFRECAKLSSKSIQGQLNNETEERLEAWLNPISDALYRDEAKIGAEEGKEYGEKHAQSPQDLRRINDFDWLYEQFSNNTLG
jgi:hypothetical protein